jgi:hypothetical protein
MVTVGGGDHKGKSARTCQGCSMNILILSVGMILTLLTSTPAITLVVATKGARGRIPGVVNAATGAAPLGVCEVNGLLPYPSHYTLPSIPSVSMSSSLATPATGMRSTHRASFVRFLGNAPLVCLSSHSLLVIIKWFIISITIEISRHYQDNIIHWHWCSFD